MTTAEVAGELGANAIQDEQPSGSQVGRLVAPLRRTIAVACMLQAVSSALGVMPFIAVAEIGRVLLAEATAALDPINERAVQQALQALTHDKTLVVVAHRLQTVQAADQILVLDQGGIVERGTHAKLLELEGRYASFWRERVRAAGWRVGTQETERTVGNVAAD